jgi:LysR family transcriptional regulator, transcriptional activator for bauABCD operon
MSRLANVDLRLLRVFLAVAKTGSYAAAQTELGIAASTISIHMSDLERRLGMRLCDRGRSGFRLTMGGEAVLQETRRLFSAIDNFDTAIHKVCDSQTEALRIGIVDCLATHPSRVLPRVLGDFSERWTGVHLQIEVGTTQKLEHDLLESKLHAAIGPNQRAINGLDFVPLYQEQHALYCGRGHPMFGKSDAGFEVTRLAKEAFVARGYMYQQDVDRIGAVNVRAVVDSLEAMAILLLSGRFIGFLPTHYAKQWVDSTQLRSILEKELGYVSNHALITKSGVKKSEILTAFTRDLKAAMDRGDFKTRPENAV